MRLIKNMSQFEVSSAIEWAAQEGWNPSTSDASSFYRGYNFYKSLNQLVLLPSFSCFILNNRSMLSVKFVSIYCKSAPWQYMMGLFNFLRLINA
jgi:hypothetical protein